MNAAKCFIPVIEQRFANANNFFLISEWRIILFRVAFNVVGCPQHQLELNWIIVGTTVIENEQRPSDISHCWLSVHAKLTQIVELAYSDAKYSTDYTHYFLKPSWGAHLVLLWCTESNACFSYQSRGEKVTDKRHVGFFWDSTCHRRWALDEQVLFSARRHTHLITLINIWIVYRNNVENNR